MGDVSMTVKGPACRPFGESDGGVCLGVPDEVRGIDRAPAGGAVVVDDPNCRAAAPTATAASRRECGARWSARGPPAPMGRAVVEPTSRWLCVRSNTSRIFTISSRDFPRSSRSTVTVSNRQSIREDRPPGGPRRGNGRQRGQITCLPLGSFVGHERAVRRPPLVRIESHCRRQMTRPSWPRSRRPIGASSALSTTPAWLSLSPPAVEVDRRRFHGEADAGNRISYGSEREVD